MAKHNHFHCHLHQSPRVAGSVWHTCVTQPLCRGRDRLTDVRETTGSDLEHRLRWHPRSERDDEQREQEIGSRS